MGPIFVSEKVYTVRWIKLNFQRQFLSQVRDDRVPRVFVQNPHCDNRRLGRGVDDGRGYGRYSCAKHTEFERTIRTRLKLQAELEWMLTLDRES